MMRCLLNHPAATLLLCAPLLMASTPGCGPQAPRESEGTRPVAASSADAATSDSAVKQTVALEIDFGNGRSVIASAPWRKGTTALDVLLAAETDKPLKIERRGEGATAFVEAIDGVRNGTDKSQRNWLVKINGKLSKESAGKTPVQPGDRVLWEYAAWE